MRRRLGWILVTASLALHLITVAAYSRQPDHLAAFTLMPLWVWGGLGLAASATAFYFLRAPLSWIITAIWSLTLLLGSDESRVLANLGNEAPLPGPAAFHRGQPVVRVMSANCALFGLGDPTADIVMWDPDVVLIQDAWPYQVKRIADRLYEGHGDHRTHDTIGVITRWSIEREVRKPHQRAQQVTIVAPDGRKFEVVNIHLLSAATDLSLWRREVWRGHRINRAIRRDELSRVLSTLDDTVGFPGIPVVFGGDFNAPPGDPVSRLLDRDFEDAQLAAGAGWGNTYHRRFPILRIDRIHATRHFTAVRCATHVTRHSDHRFVVADLLLQPVPPVR